jgi:hypothetical protein
MWRVHHGCCMRHRSKGCQESSREGGPRTVLARHAAGSLPWPAGLDASSRPVSEPAPPAAERLAAAKEIAIDLEAHNYRSFQVGRLMPTNWQQSCLACSLCGVTHVSLLA